MKKSNRYLFFLNQYPNLLKQNEKFEKYLSYNIDHSDDIFYYINSKDKIGIPKDLENDIFLIGYREGESSLTDFQIKSNKHIKEIKKGYLNSENSR